MCICMRLCLCMCGYSRRPEKGLRIPLNWSYRWCEPLGYGARNQIQVLARAASTNGRALSSSARRTFPKGGSHCVVWHISLPSRLILMLASGYERKAAHEHQTHQYSYACLGLLASALGSQRKMHFCWVSQSWGDRKVLFRLMITSSP